MVAMKRLGMAPESIDAVVVSHLHGDHFGGIPFLVLDQQFARRERPLLVAGPPGVRQRVLEAMEVLFPGSSRAERRFELRFVELVAGAPTEVGSSTVIAFEVAHASGAQAYGLRLDCGGVQIAYSGDTQWTDILVELAEGADLFVCEAYTFDRPIRYHLSHNTLAQHRSQLGCRRLVLTHPSPELLAHKDELEADLAEDGLMLTLS